MAITTIQVQSNTLNLLRKIKDSTNLKSYDDVINFLAKRRVEHSMAGALAIGKKYSVEDMLENLRDKSDRF